MARVGPTKRTVELRFETIFCLVFVHVLFLNSYLLKAISTTIFSVKVSEHSAHTVILPLLIYSYHGLYASF